MSVEVVLGYLRQKLPTPVTGQIDTVLSGAGTATNIGDLAKGLGGSWARSSLPQTYLESRKEKSNGKTTDDRRYRTGLR
jgi:hypothetical protein